jgi:hypothetical protein
MSGTGKIWNPNGGGRGEASLTSIAFANCTSGLCAVNPELEAKKTPWASRLVGGTPIVLKINNLELIVKCNAEELLKVTGALSVPVLKWRRSGKSWVYNK